MRSSTLALGFVVLNAFVLFGLPVPHSNEYVYLLRLRALQDPSFLRGDWTFHGTFGEHAVFNTVVSPLTSVFSIELLGWLGRIVCWVLLAMLLLEVGRRLGLGAWPAAVALVISMAGQLRVVGQDWIFGTFEAKPVAYVFLFAGLLLALRGSVIPALACAGLALTFHPGVGIWASPPLVAAMAIQPATRRATLRWCWVAALLAFPGAVLVAGVGESSNPRDLWEFMVKTVFPHHLDPHYFGWASVAVLALMLVGNVAYTWSCTQRREPGWEAFRFVAVFQLFLAIPVVAGLLAFVTGRYEYLRFLPFRVCPVVVSVFFFFTLAHVWTRRRELWEARREKTTAAVVALLAIGTVTMAVVWNPAKLYAFSARENYRAWTADDSELDRALDWVAANTPRDAVLIMPPGTDDTFYRSERAQVANVKHVRFEDLEEWRRRIEDQFADGFIDRTDDSLREDDLEPGYAALTEDDVLALQRRYNAQYIVSPSDYSFEVLHRTGRWKVYELPATSSPRSDRARDGITDPRPGGGRRG